MQREGEVIVSVEIVGNGADAREVIHVREADGSLLDLIRPVGSDDEEPRIPHTMVAPRLGYAREDSFANLIKAHKRAGFINPLAVFTSGVENSKGGRRKVIYMLSRDEIVYLIGKAETKQANALMVRVSKWFVAAWRALHERSSVESTVLATVQAELLELRTKIAQLTEHSQQHPWLSPTVRASQLRSQLATLAALEQRVFPVLSAATLRKRIDMELRAVVNYAPAAAHTYEAMPLATWERAMLHLASRVKSVSAALRASTQTTISGVH